MWKEKFFVEGVLPERAILRLKREGISVYNAKKTAKNRIVFSLKKKDCEKAFTIFPKVCYNTGKGEMQTATQSNYTLLKIGADAPLKLWEFFKKRWGIFIGIAVFFGVTAYFQNYALRIEIAGTDCYRREIFAALEKGGVAVGKPYRKENIDKIRSEILALDGVGYCSVKKRGTVVTVEVRFDPFSERKLKNSPFLSLHTGMIEELTTLRGEPLKKVGQQVLAGEPIVANYFSVVDQWGENIKQVAVAPIARARIACVYESELQADDETQAFAKGYLELRLSPLGRITGKSLEKLENGAYKVRIEYTEIQTINF